VLLSCPISLIVLQITTHHHSVTSTNHAVSLVPFVPLSFSSPPITIQSPVQIIQFFLSHLPYCLSVHHPPQFSNQYKPSSFSCPVCPTVFQFTTHHYSGASTNHTVPLVPFVPLSFSTPPITIQ
jgi:hypothetical protein